MKKNIRFIAIVLVVCTLTSCNHHAKIDWETTEPFFYDSTFAQTESATDEPTVESTIEPTVEPTVEPTTYPPASEIQFSLTGNAVFGDGSLTAENGQISFAITENDYADNFRLSCEIVIKALGVGGIKVLADGKGGGIYLAVDFARQNITLYKIKDKYYDQLGQRKCTFEKDIRIPVIIDYFDGILKVYFNENPLDTDPYPKFELTTKLFSSPITGEKIEFLMGDGIADFHNVSISEAAKKYEGPTYVNPVIQGADPDVLYYDGVYYLYQRIADGNNVFRVSTSTDLVKWETGNIVYKHDPNSDYPTSTYMSPNVFHYNGKFYLIFAAKDPKVGNHTLFCAVSDTPDGEFEHVGGKQPLHKGMPEIGGHPYVDPDTGKLYLSLVRFGGGNHIFLEEYNIVDDRLVPVEGTLTKVISPTQSYEIDEFGKISEGGVIMKHNGYYYMIYASGHYLGHYGEAYAVAEDILGPYVKYENNDILAYTGQVDGCGDAVFVTSPDGSELFIMYHTHSLVGHVEPRMTCIDRIKFVPNPNGGPDILSVYGPTNTPQPLPGAED